MGWGDDTSGAAAWLGGDGGASTVGATLSMGAACGLALLHNGSALGLGGGEAPPAHCVPPPGATFQHLAVGPTASCGIATIGDPQGSTSGEGEVQCWGEEDGNSPPAWTPPDGLPPQVLVLPTAGATYALDKHGNASCWGAAGCTLPSERLKLLASDGQGAVWLGVRG